MGDNALAEVEQRQPHSIEMYVDLNGLARRTTLRGALQTSRSELHIRESFPRAPLVPRGHRAREDCFYDINSSSFYFYLPERMEGSRGQGFIGDPGYLCAFLSAQAPHDFFL